MCALETSRFHRRALLSDAETPPAFAPPVKPLFAHDLSSPRPNQTAVRALVRTAFHAAVEAVLQIPPGKAALLLRPLSPDEHRRV